MSFNAKMLPKQFRFWALALLLTLPLIELTSHFTIRARVASPQDWKSAGRFVDGLFRPGDALESAPSWTDPLLRHVLGEHIQLKDAGRSDLAAYSRLWRMSVGDETIHGNKDILLKRSFGNVYVKLYTLPKPVVVYDLVEHIAEAAVDRFTENGSEPCQRVSDNHPQTGGLFRTVIEPKERFICDRERPWLWVGATMLEDLAHKPRYCVWQHAAGDKPIVTRYEHVPLGEEFVMYGGLYYEHERQRTQGFVEATVSVNGTPIGKMFHRSGDGWKMASWRIPKATKMGQTHGQISIAVRAPDPHLRSFCWSASTRVLTRKPPS